MLSKIVALPRRVLGGSLISNALRGRVRDNQIFYQAFDGMAIGCNPYAIFRQLVSDSRFSSWTHVWAVRPEKMNEPIVKRLLDYPNVRVVGVGSIQYYREVGRSRYLINNTSFPAQFMKKPGQVYLNTWHGTPLKKMGYDMPGSRAHTRNIIRNLVMSDYLLSPSPFFTHDILGKAYRLDGFYQGRILEDGYPRIDHLLESAANPEESRAQLADLGLELSPRQRIVLFAPTWKGDDWQDPDVGIDSLRNTITTIQESLPADARLLVRVHQFAYEKVSQTSLAPLLMSNDIPANLVLGMTDMLISDYSSILVDYLAVDRPTISYLEDYHDYAGDRGLYDSFDDFPAVRAGNLAELATAVSAWAAGADPLAAGRAEWRQRYLPWDDGQATRRICRAVFDREHPRLVDISASDKPRVLLYAGGFQRNGITQSLLNLVDNLDPQRIELTVAYRYNENNQTPDQFPEWVRVLPTPGKTNQTLTQFVTRALVQRRLIPGTYLTYPWLRRQFLDEKRRILGDTGFDYAIQYNGYSPFWAALITPIPASKRLIWLHNDMPLEIEKVVNGKHVHRRGLSHVFELYRYFDTLVSVTPSLMAIHQTALTAYVPADRHGYVSNLVNFDRMLELAEEDPSTAPLREPIGPNDIVPIRVELPTDTRIFVTVSRLSPEKNHQLIIRAFAEVARTRDDVSLLIIGDGPLREELEELADSCGVRSQVIFAGYQDNPFALVARSDCFVFASLYEGQGLVLLEARALGLPIVTTDFNVVHDVVPPEAGVIVQPTEEALTRGMLRYLEGEVPSSPFDPTGYNVEQLGRFMALLQR